MKYNHKELTNFRFQRIFYFIHERDLKRFILFILVGGVNTLFGYSLYSLLIYLQLHYIMASFIATVGGVLFNFKTTGGIVFKNKNNRLLLKFICVYIVTYLLNIGCLSIFSRFQVNMYFAGAVLVLPIALLTFKLQRKYVFGVDDYEID